MPPKRCPVCAAKHPWRGVLVDGRLAEWMCFSCLTRVGKFSGRVLAVDEHDDMDAADEFVRLSGMAVS